MSNIVFTAGSVLRGDDAAGPMLAKLLGDNPVEGWQVIDGGQTPEDDLAVIRRIGPSRVLFVDAASMGLTPGEIRRLQAGDVAKQFMFTTHSLPITFLLGELDKICNDVTFLGIQMGSMDFFDPLTPTVMDAVKDIEACVRAGGDFSQYKQMGE